MFQKIGEAYGTPLERLTVQLSHRKWATIHNIYLAAIHSAGITRTLGFAHLQMGQLTFMGHLPFVGPKLAERHTW